MPGKQRYTRSIDIARGGVFGFGAAGDSTPDFAPPTGSAPAAVGSPAFATYAYLNSSTGVSNNSNTTWDWTAELFDDLGAHDNSTNPSRLTIPSDGLYMTVLQLAWAANASGRRQAIIKKTDAGGTTTRAGSVIQASPTSSTYQVATTTEYCLAGDYYQADVLQTSGGSLSLTGGDGASFFILIKLSDAGGTFDGGSSGIPFAVTDGTTTVTPTTTLRLPAGTVADNGGGEAEYTPAPISLIAQAHLSSNQTVTSGSADVINFDSVDHDPLSIVTTGASWHVTAPATGRYRAEIENFYVDPNGSGYATDDGVKVKPYKNGSALTGSPDLSYWDAGDAIVTTSKYPFLTGSITCSLAAGDTFALKFHNNTGASRKVSQQAIITFSRVA